MPLFIGILWQLFLLCCQHWWLPNSSSFINGGCQPLTSWMGAHAMATTQHHDLYKFIEAPSRPSIVFGEHDYRYFLLLYCLLELQLYILSSPNFIIISKCVKPCINQGLVEVIGKVLAGVFTSKTQEHLIFTIRKP